MMFWIAILAGALFVWLAVRVGFYETWVLLFNVVISIYVSVFLSPILVELAPPPSGAASYHVALCLTVLAGGCFAILQGLSYVFLTGQYHIPFPRVFDIVLSGVLGFAAGFLIVSFIAVVLTTTPLAEHKIVGRLWVGQAAPAGEGTPNANHRVWESESRRHHPVLRPDSLLRRLSRRRQHDRGHPAAAPGDEKGQSEPYRASQPIRMNRRSLSRPGTPQPSPAVAWTSTSRTDVICHCERQRGNLPPTVAVLAKCR